MKTSITQTPQSTFFLTNPTPSPPFLTPFPKTLTHHFPSPICRSRTRTSDPDLPITPKPKPRSPKRDGGEESGKGYSRMVVVGAVSVGLVLVGLGVDQHKAMAFVPEGPLMEEFWDNVRRYALYALTVSSGALYTIWEPIGELLKNPISAILVVLIFGGSFYILSQVLNAMVGVTTFSYEYSY